MEEASRIDELICRYLNGRTSEAEGEAVRAWRQRSADNEAYYRDLERLLGLAEMVPLATGPVRDPLAAVRGSERSIALAQPTRGFPWRRRWWAVGSAAAAVVALAFVARLALLPAYRPPLLEDGVFATGDSETATVALGDGTVVRLAPDSRLRVSASDRERAVTLHGRAFFAVASMPGRPFRVRAEGGEVLVLGTRFEVTARAQDLRLVVLEGNVELGTGTKRVRVTAGEVSAVTQGTVAAPQKIADPQAMVAWLGKFLVFQDATLREAAVELGRTYGVRVEITDSTVGDLRITGWYADRTLEDVLTLVCGAVRARCEVERGTVTIAR